MHPWGGILCAGILIGTFTASLHSPNGRHSTPGQHCAVVYRLDGLNDIIIGDYELICEARRGVLTLFPFVPFHQQQPFDLHATKWFVFKVNVLILETPVGKCFPTVNLVLDVKKHGPYGGQQVPYVPI